MQYLIHPLAEIFPRMTEKEIDELAADIKAHGLREPIWLIGDQVIDGRHRMIACERAGVPLQVRQYEGDNPAAFVVSLNLKRRHLNESQRAMVASGLANLGKGVRADRSIDPSTTQESAAEMLNVSVPSLKRAKQVTETGTPELVQAVQSGAVSVSAAADVATLPPEEQTQIVAAGRESVVQAAKDIREGKRPHVAHNSGENEWYTPDEILNLARETLGGIDLDPASSAIANERVRASMFYTKDDDGLSKPWSGRVWMNPPYAQPLIGDFAEAVASKYEAREIDAACVLVNNATETRWFQRMLELASAVCFLRGRVKFVSPSGEANGAPLQGQAVIYFGGKKDEFCRRFSEIGRVLERV